MQGTFCETALDIIFRDNNAPIENGISDTLPNCDHFVSILTRKMETPNRKI
jgi:hypothetical protein